MPMQDRLNQNERFFGGHRTIHQSRSSLMNKLEDVVTYCDERTRSPGFPDFPGAMNGLQVSNSGHVSRIGAAVDAGLVPFEQAIERGVDFLIVHHGLFWTPPNPLTGTNYRKIKTLFEGDCAIYGCHLPLDAHPEIGNNVLLAFRLGLTPSGTFLPFEGHDLGVLAQCSYERDELRDRLEVLFPSCIAAIECGPKEVDRIAIVTGGGSSALAELSTSGTSTLITGELRQHHFNQAQEAGWNLYCCGHYATETFGVSALAEEAAAKFGINWEFIETECPL
jgi:dinuclear metal center YbgI/SA1388 family protein